MISRIAGGGIGRHPGSDRARAGAVLFGIGLIALTLCIACPHGHAYQPEWNTKYFNPNPMKDDLIVPLPGGGAMVFRPVVVVQGKITESKPFHLGNSKYPPKEFPREGSISGVFEAGNNRRLFYIGKYETTVSQFDAVMKADRPQNLSPLPKVNVSWFEAVQFADELTRYLLKYHKEIVPQDDGTPGYVRLPTEEEWEFACRGGEIVDANLLDGDNFIPGTEDLADYVQYYRVGDVETVQPIGRTKKANPLGLYDILGNAGEMCFEIFRLNYHLGRFGGFVVKGGNIRAPGPSEIRSSFRVEVPFYDRQKGDASRNNLTGFRVVISAPYIVSMQRDSTIKTEWDKNSVPGSAELKKSFNAVSDSIGKLEGQTADPKVKEGLKRLEEEQKKMAAAINELEMRDAQSFYRIGAFCADTIRLQLLRLPILAEALANMRKDPATKPEVIGRAEANFAKMQKSIEKNLNTYGYAVESLNKKFRNLPGTVVSAFEQVLEKHKLEGDEERIRTLGLMRLHVEKFVQRDPAAWKSDLTNLKE